MKRKHKSYSRPKRPFDKKRIEEEKKIVEQYGLKNKREIWKAEERIKKIREGAKKMVSAGEKEREEFLSKLVREGLKVKSIAEVLSLTKEDYLNRRLQTIVFNKGLAKTPKGARQMITHKKILVNNKSVNIPSYHVSSDLESKINIKTKKINKKKTEEIPAESKE